MTKLYKEIIGFIGPSAAIFHAILGSGLSHNNNRNITFYMKHSQLSIYYVGCIILILGLNAYIE